MRFEVKFCAIAICVGFLGAMVIAGDRVALAQGCGPLCDDRPARIVRKKKPNRKKPVRPVRTVQRAPLLRIEWRVLKVRDDGTHEETSPLAVFHPGDRLRLGLRTNQDGFLYVIHQNGPTQPGQIIFPDSRVNGGRNDVGKFQEFILPSGCPPQIQPRDCSLIVTPPAGQELFTLVYSRDPLIDLPNAATEIGGGIPVQTLVKLKAGSGQTLRRQRGGTPLSVVVVNTNTRDNEDILETLILNKGQ